MVKIMIFLKRKQGITHEQFRAHYESSHARLAQKHFGHLLISYSRHYPISAVLDPSNVPEGTKAPPYDIGYDAIAEMRVKDIATFEEILHLIKDSNLGPMFYEDEQRFLNQKGCVLLLCEEVDTGTAFTGEAVNVLS